MSHLIHRTFVAHPRSVDETYLQHLGVAAWFAGRLFAAGGAALVHAILPCLFEKTAGNIILEMSERMKTRR